MKKNNRKPKSRKSPKKTKPTVAAGAASMSADVVKKGAKPDGKPGRAVQKTAKTGKPAEGGGASKPVQECGAVFAASQSGVEKSQVAYP